MIWPLAIQTVAALSTLTLQMDCRLVSCLDDQSIETTVTKATVGSLGTEVEGARPQAEETDSNWAQYRAVIDCPGNSPQNPERALCNHAVTFCEENVPDSAGPYSILYRRMMTGIEPQSDWQRMGRTCHTDALPTSSGDDDAELTEAMVIQQFHETDFALPVLNIQPPGGTALVNMPVFAQIEWSESGHAPQSIDSTTLVGHEIRIRPIIESITYTFEDGATVGPTTSLGGAYPEGDITHTYTRPGEHQPTATVTFTGEVSVDDSGWETIPSTIEVTGPPTDLTTVTSRNYLLTNPDSGGR